MRSMNLPKLPTRPNSLKECGSLYLERLPADDFCWPSASLLLTAFMAWPNAKAERDSFVATLLAKFFQTSGEATVVNESAKGASAQKSALERFGGAGAIARPAFDHLLTEISQMQRKWLLVADIFQMIVDIIEWEVY